MTVPRTALRLPNPIPSQPLSPESSRRGRSAQASSRETQYSALSTQHSTRSRPSRHSPCSRLPAKTCIRHSPFNIPYNPAMSVASPETSAPRRRPRLLWTLLGAMVLVGLLPLIVSHVFLIGINRDALETLEKKYLTRSAVTIAADIKNLLTNNTQQLTKIAASIRAMRTALPPGSDPFVYAAHANIITDYITPDGDLLALRILNRSGQGERGKAAAVGSRHRSGTAPRRRSSVHRPAIHRHVPGAFVHGRAMRGRGRAGRRRRPGDGRGRRSRQPPADHRAYSGGRQARRHRLSRRPQRPRAHPQRAFGRRPATRRLEPEDRPGVQESAHPARGVVRRGHRRQEGHDARHRR